MNTQEEEPLHILIIAPNQMALSAAISLTNNLISSVHNEYQRSSMTSGVTANMEGISHIINSKYSPLTPPQQQQQQLHHGNAYGTPNQSSYQQAAQVQQNQPFPSMLPLQRSQQQQQQIPVYQHTPGQVTMQYPPMQMQNPVQYHPVQQCMMVRPPLQQTLVQAQVQSPSYPPQQWQQQSTSYLPQQQSTSYLPQQQSTSYLPPQQSASYLPQQQSASYLPQQQSLSYLPQQPPCPPPQPPLCGASLSTNITQFSPIYQSHGTSSHPMQAFPPSAPAYPPTPPPPRPTIAPTLPTPTLSAVALCTSDFQQNNFNSQFSEKLAQSTQVSKGLADDASLMPPPTASMNISFKKAKTGSAAMNNVPFFYPDTDAVVRPQQKQSSVDTDINITSSSKALSTENDPNETESYYDSEEILPYSLITASSTRNSKYSRDRDRRNNNLDEGYSNNKIERKRDSNSFRIDREDDSDDGSDDGQDKGSTISKRKRTFKEAAHYASKGNTPSPAFNLESKTPSMSSHVPPREMPYNSREKHEIDASNGKNKYSEHPLRKNEVINRTKEESISRSGLGIVKTKSTTVGLLGLLGAYEDLSDDDSDD